MALTMEAPETLDDEVHAAPQSEAIGVDEANAELTEVGRENQNAAGQASADVQAEAAEQLPEVDEEEKRFWATIAIKGKLADCGRDIRQAEAKIDALKMQIKEEKEFLKGEQIRLTRLAGDLADIIDGHPLPIDPNAKKEDEDNQAAGDQVDNDAEASADAWRDKPTADLLDGLKGLGQKKLDALVDAAPTAGDLEDLRGEASRAHQAFREKLPSGFGQKIADAIEDRLIEHVAKCAPSAEDQAAAEREADEGAEDDEPNPVAGKIEQREREQLADTSSENDAGDDYEDVSDDDVL